MKHTREQLDALSKLEINKALLTAAGIEHYEQEGKVYYGNKHDGDNVISICTEFNYEKWQDIMSLAVQHKIDLLIGDPCMATNSAATYFCSGHGFTMFYRTANPQRAIACCLIMVLESKNG